MSKIGNFNLIYNDSEIEFTVSFVSDKPTSLENIKSALIQILRINGLSMLEEGNNLIIHKNPAIKQIPTVISKNLSDNNNIPGIVTRVFKIYEGNPTSIAAIITPLLSSSAMVEVSLENKAAYHHRCDL